MNTKCVEDLEPGDRIKVGLVGTVRTVHAVDVTDKRVIVHVLLSGPNTPTAWSAGRTRALSKRHGDRMQMAD